MLGESEVKRALDQPPTLELVQQLEQRAVLSLVPAELVAELGLADREGRRGRSGRGSPAPARPESGAGGFRSRRRSSLHLPQAAEQGERAAGAGAALGAAGLLRGGVDALVPAHDAHVERVAGADESVDGRLLGAGCVTVSSARNGPLLLCRAPAVAAVRGRYLLVNGRRRSRDDVAGGRAGLGSAPAATDGWREARGTPVTRRSVR